MKTLTVIAEDKIGLLADISYILAKSRINIDSINADIIGKKAIISLLVRDAERAREVLNRSGYVTSAEESIVIKLPNRVGELEQLTKKLCQDGINIEDLSMLSNSHNEGVFLIKVDKPRKASRILSDFIIDTK
jgi:hypothetical protein